MNIEEVRKAAELVERHKTRHAHQPFDVLVAAMRTLSDWAIMELSIRDAEAAGRALPITEEWLHGTRDGRWQDWSRFDIGGEWNSDLSVRKNNIGKWYCLLQQDNDDHSGREVFSAGFIATRGQLLDLLAALKGESK